MAEIRLALTAASAIATSTDGFVSVFAPSGTELGLKDKDGNVTIIGTGGAGVASLNTLGGTITLAPSGVVQIATDDGSKTITIYSPTPTVAASTLDHNQLLNLTVADPHTQYVNINGRTGGQTVAGNLNLSPSGVVHIGGTAATTGITLDVQSSTGGFGFPSLTTAQRNAIAPNRGGVYIWNSENQRLEAWDGSNWYLPQTTVNGVANTVTIAASGAAVVNTVGSTIYVYAPSGGGGGGGTQPYAGISALSSAATSLAVSFATPLGSTPAVVCWLSSTNAANNIISSQGTGISASGFTALFGATIPDTTYSLNWIASVPHD